MYNSVLSIRVASLYGFQPSSVVLCIQNSDLKSKLQVSMCPRHDLSFCAYTTTCLASELLVSMGPSPHLWFLHAKQRLLEMNYKSLWVPDLICGFCLQNSDFWTKITSLYWSQTSHVVECMQNIVICTRMTSL